MPKVVSPQELDTLVAAITATPHGWSVEALASAFPALPRRTLQRRLAQLVSEKRLAATGRGPSRRYHLPLASEPEPTALIDAEGISLSQAAAELQVHVRRPLARRTPVGYRREFLADYRPNQTFYLGATLREHLRNLGRSPVAPRPAGTYARQIMDRLLVDLSWSSSRLEGNTYSRLDTQNLIEFGRYAEGKDRLEAQMILNHKAAIEMLVDGASEIGFNRYTLQNLHALLADNLLPDASAGGRLRTIDVTISGSVYQPTALPQLIEECFDTLLAKADAIIDPFEQAFFAMVHLPYLQPFDDVNKRVSRLAANIPLIRHNLAPLSFVDVPEKAYIEGTLALYELNRPELLRDVFAWAYERSCQRYTLLREALPQPDAFRLRHREALAHVVANIVRARREPTTTLIQELAQPEVPAADIADFVALVINELAQLHEGNIARYRLRPAEFMQWQAMHPLSRSPIAPNGQPPKKSAIGRSA